MVRYQASLMAVTPFRFWLLEIFNGNIVAIGLIPVLALIIYGVFRLTKGTVYA